jgi:2-haloacid dehalogenase
MNTKPDLPAFNALSFDCYGTMIDWEAGILAVLRPWLETSGLALGDEEILAAYSEAEPQVEKARPDALYPDILRAVVKSMARRFQLEVSVMAREGLANSVGNWPPFSDSADALARLKCRYKLIILSNVDRASIARSVQLLDVEFDAIYTAEDIGSYKPDPRNFDYLLAHAKSDLDLEPHQILHVAQSLFHDHVPAKEKGFVTCWIDRRSEREGSGATKPPAAPVKPDFTFKTLAELADAAGV